MSMNCRDRCATDAYDSVIRRLEGVENKNLDQDNAIDAMGATIPDFYEVDTLKINVDALQNEKLDITYMDEDVHFGPVAITKEGTAVIATFTAVNPTTGASTPMSILLPGATTTDAGVMDASSVAWIADAEERISALEGLSDVKAVADLTDAPTQTQLTTGWVAVAGKQPETGDILQDINNSNLWVYVNDMWVLYGTIVTVPLATTSTIGGVRDTALTAPGNRWYAHVEVDGRLTLIGGDSLSTLIDTTIPAVQSATNSKVSKSGDTMTGILHIDTNTQFPLTITTDVTYPFRIRNKTLGKNAFSLYNSSDGTNPVTQVTGPNGAHRWDLRDDSIVYRGNHRFNVDPPADDNTGSLTSCRWVRARLAGKQDSLTFDDAPVSGSANPVKSGGVYTALATKADASGVPPLTAFAWTYGSGTLTTNAGTCGYNYAYYTIGDVVTMRFTIGDSVDNTFNVPLPVSVTSATVQCMGISDNASFWVDYGGTATSTITVNRAQGTPAERSFHMLVIGQPSGL